MAEGNELIAAVLGDAMAIASTSVAMQRARPHRERGEGEQAVPVPISATFVNCGLRVRADERFEAAGGRFVLAVCPRQARVDFEG